MNNSKNIFLGMPKRTGIEKIGFVFLIPVGVVLGFLKVLIVNGYAVNLLDVFAINNFNIWIGVVKCWNNNSPVFRGHANAILQLDMLGIILSLFISVISVRDSSISVWVNRQEFRVLLIAAGVLFAVILSDFIATMWCGGVQKENVNYITYITHNTISGLLIKTYVQIMAGYYLPSVIRMLIRKL